MSDRVPSHHELFNPALRALKVLGGSGSLHEINDKEIANLSLPEDVVQQPHDLESGSETELEYRLAWARTYLKKYGLIKNSARGVWALKDNADRIEEVKPSDVVRFVRSLSERQRMDAVAEPDTTDSGETPEELASWRVQLHKLLVNELTPDAFERLVQRVLRESGFIQVEVTGRSGDGGIDGKGIARIHGLMSFRVRFQCKRYNDSVTPSMIRDFRGAMVGRAGKGLFITTGTFTKGAIEEATRDGAPPIDTVDGDQLIDKLKELKLGVRVELVESVVVAEEWFRKI